MDIQHGFFKLFCFLFHGCYSVHSYFLTLLFCFSLWSGSAKDCFKTSINVFVLFKMILYFEGYYVHKWHLSSLVVECLTDAKLI